MADRKMRKLAMLLKDHPNNPVLEPDEAISISPEGRQINRHRWNQLERWYIHPRRAQARWLLLQREAAAAFQNPVLHRAASIDVRFRANTRKVRAAAEAVRFTADLATRLGVNGNELVHAATTIQAATRGRFSRRKAEKKNKEEDDDDEEEKKGLMGNRRGEKVFVPTECGSISTPNSTRPAPTSPLTLADFVDWYAFHPTARTYFLRLRTHMVKYYVRDQMIRTIGHLRRQFFHGVDAVDVIDPRIMWKRRQRIRTRRLLKRRNIAAGRDADEVSQKDLVI